MKRFVDILIFLLLFTLPLFGEEVNDINRKSLIFRKTPTESELKADSIMRLVIENAERYEKVLSGYQAEIYIKGRTEILKKNQLIRFANHLFPVNRKVPDMLFEMVSLSEYSAPNIYYHDFKAVNGNSIPSTKKQEEILHFLNLNIYAPTAYNDGILMPVSKKAFKYYSFNLKEVQDSTGLKIYTIHFSPKQWSQKLVSGNLYIVDKYWTIDQVDLKGRVYFADFDLTVQFERDPRRFMLPQTANLQLEYHLLGNSVVNKYHTNFTNRMVEWIEEDNEKRKHNKLDLTHYYRLSTDTIPIIRDSLYWNDKRDIPLTEDEEQLYVIEEEEIKLASDTGQMEKYLKLTEKITGSLSYSTPTTRLRYSGFLNPFRLGYSKRDGITYQQKVRLSHNFDNDRQLRFTPDIGFVFKRKEVFFSVATDWEYSPEKLGALSLIVGNNNNSYSSEIMEDINVMLKDSTFNFDDLNFKYFRHYYVEFKNKIEITNGLILETGISYHKRRAVKNKSNLDNDTEGELTDYLNDKYNDFTPIVRIFYTPKMYYRMDGKRKEYIYSYYPSLSLEFARGIPKVFNSTGNYTRVEANIHQSIRIGFLRKFNYNISGGAYTLQKSTYFADFTYFRRRYFPQTWDDRIGGSFNLLSGDWFNASDKYVQGHFMYESPFILLQLLRRDASRYVLSERFYYGHAWTPVLPSYNEVGYGIGNNIFNIALFAGFEKLKYQSIGFKFSFELFH